MGWWYDFDEEVPDDEVTLSDYATQPDTLVIEGPVRAVSKRGDIGREWWGREWVAAMEHLGLTARLQRGKRYARNGSVKRLEIGRGIAFAPVQGSRRNPYRTAIHLKPLTPDEWEKALEALAEQAIYSAKLLAGEMPGDIEGVFQSAGLSLFPQSKEDIIFECSCPDWGNPCKHAAAVYYLVAEQLDADPFVLFHIRGRTREDVLAWLRRGAESPRPSDVPPLEESIPPAPPLDADLGAFWKGGDVKVQAPSHHEVPLALKQLGPPPGGIEDALRGVYARIAEAAAQLEAENSS